MYFTILYYTILYYTILYYTILYYTILFGLERQTLEPEPHVALQPLVELDVPGARWQAVDPDLNQGTRGPKVPKHGVFRVFIIGTLRMLLGRYMLLFGSLEP